MAFWNKKDKVPNKAPTDALDSGLENEVHELDKFPYLSSSTTPTGSGLYTVGTGALSCTVGPSYISYGAPYPPPTSIAVDPMSFIVYKEGDSIVLENLNQLPRYKLSKAELEHVALFAPKNTISIASLLLLFLEESEKLENND